MDYKIINYIITFYCWSRYTGPYSWWTKTRTVWGTHPVCCTTCNSLPIRNLLGTTVPFFYLSIKKGKGAYSSLWNSPQNYVSRTWVSCCRKSNKTIQSKHPTGFSSLTLNDYHNTVWNVGAWYNLLQHVILASCLPVFLICLKTYLFTCSFPRLLLCLYIC